MKSIRTRHGNAKWDHRSLKVSCGTTDSHLFCGACRNITCGESAASEIPQRAQNEGEATATRYLQRVGETSVLP